ncbi:MAG: radical SAM protein [Candidatus Thorarchaeota archaeon]
MKKKIKWETIFNAQEEELKDFYSDARNESWKFFGRKLKVYYPSDNFPTISLTGIECSQNCLYCNKQYLKNMIQISNPEELINFSEKLEAKGGKGILLSGGYDINSITPLKSFTSAIKQIKTKTNLKINAHTGLIGIEQAKELHESGIDVISFDLVINNQVIKEILQSSKTGKEYIDSFQAIQKAGLNIVPHICLGLYYGTLEGNLEAITQAIKLNPELIVFLGLIPTKGTKMENSPVLRPELLGKIILFTRFLNPKIETSLGCMRVRLPEYEKLAVDAGINRIAVPKKNTIEYAQKEYKLLIERNDSCCAL